MAEIVAGEVTRMEEEEREEWELAAETETERLRLLEWAKNEPDLTTEGGSCGS